MWVSDAAAARWQSPRCVAALSAGERRRGHSFSLRRDEVSYLGRRVFLRVVLAAYLGADPGGLVLARRCVHCGSGSHGKPFLSSGAAGARLEFSVSSSKRMVLLGVRRAAPIGVDIEVSDPDLPVEGLAAYACGAGERRALAACAPGARASRFLFLWTLKEAYLKALGIGLARDPADLSVVEGADGGLLLRDRAPSAGQRDWRLLAADAGGHPVALAHGGEADVRWLSAT